MSSLNAKVSRYRDMIQEGTVVEVYREILDFIMELRTHFARMHPELNVSGSIYQGYMDMTYFALSPAQLKDRKLKIAVVFLHETTSFEVWLSGVNKKVQKDYWKQFLKSGWDRYMVVPAIEGKDSIVQNVIVEDPDFNDLQGLTGLIEEGVMEFMVDIVEFLSES